MKQLKLGLGADMSQICLIDAKNFLFRNHFTHRGLAGPDGEPTSVLYGFLTGLLSLNKRLPDVPLVIVWDGEGETWRHRFLRDHKRSDPIKPKQGTDWVGRQIAQSINFITQAKAVRVVSPIQAAAKPRVPAEKPVGYKANRVNAAQMDDKVIAVSQIPELKRAMRGLGLRNYRIPGLEGDDLIGILATAILKNKLYDSVIIHSSDTDFHQLLRDDISILKGVHPEMIWVKAEDVLREYGVSAKEWTKYRALTGDTSDNIPKLLYKVGPVKALKLLRAGVDASSDLMPTTAVNAVMDMTKGQLDIDDFQKRLKKNYIACKILTVDQYAAPMMSPDVTERITEMLDCLRPKSFQRSADGRSEAAYREFCEWCSSHGMNELRSKAVEFAELV
jgi:5'-3' exonuclease